MEIPQLDYPATTGALMQQAAARFGDAEFIVSPERRMTFAQAERASRRFGQQLLAAGVGLVMVLSNVPLVLNRYADPA